VLSLGKLAPGQQQYYLDTVARGAEEYYTGAKEAPGQWLGAGSARLGLAGEVDADALGRVLEHADPATGTYRLTAAKSAPVVAGFDVTFCAPKSVSLLFALGEPEVSNEVRNAADAAVTASLGVLEGAACRVRRGKGGATVLSGDGFVAAGFRHRTSRAGDPHLHTHVVVANLAHSPADDRWTALDARPLYSWLSPVGHLYEAHLRWELTHRLGVAWGEVGNGIADVEGVPRAAIKEFSTRRRQIEAHLAEHGQHGARAAQLAAYATRQTKTFDQDPEGLLPAWQERAVAVGLDPDALAAAVGRSEPMEPPVSGSDAAERLYRWLASPKGLTARASTFGERDVIKAICNALPTGGRVDQILDLAEGFLASPHVVALRPDQTAAVIRRDDGTIIPTGAEDACWTTPELLDLEARMIISAQARRHIEAGIATQVAVDVAVSERGLTPEQEQMVRSVCASGHGIEIVEGVAGAGKTYALAAARQAWEASGYQVIGCSLAARAARNLQDDAGIPSATLDRLIGDLDRNRRALDERTVVVVDESAMVGTRKLTRLLDHAEAARSKVVLVGDSCQLPEIDAGGAFRGLRARLGASHLTDNRRQTEPWERRALADLRHGGPSGALDTYDTHQRVHQAASDAEAREQLVAAWLDTRRDGSESLMIAGRLRDVDDLNRRARHALQAERPLGPDEILLAGRLYVTGDEVLTLRNDYDLGVLNGTRATIEHVDLHGETVRLRADGGARVDLPFRYAEAGHLTHGYATTIHKAQGLTVDHCYVLADETTSREHAYTALSRGRQTNHLYVIIADARVEERHATEVEPEPLQEVRRALTRSIAQHLAIDTGKPPAEETPLDAALRKRALARAKLGDAPPDPITRWQKLHDDHRREEALRRQAVQHHQSAEKDLRSLGPLGRRIHPARREAIETRIEKVAEAIAAHDDRLDGLSEQIDQLAPDVQARRTWERHHAHDLRRLEALDTQIEMTERLDRIATRSTEQSLDHDLGLGL
jgi:conjugative relaxase-like TrwC/TraI family protein